MSMYVNGQKVAPTKSVQTTSDTKLYIHSGQVKFSGNTTSQHIIAITGGLTNPVINQSIDLYFTFISKTSTQQFTDYNSFKQAIITLFNNDNEKMYNTNFMACITGKDGSEPPINFDDIGPFIKSTKSTLTVKTTGYTKGYNDINFDSFSNFNIVRYVINELV